MFPRIVRTRKKSGVVYSYLVISESVRDNQGRSTTRNVAKLGNMGDLDQRQAKSLVDGLIRIFQLEDYALSNDVEILRSYEHGSILLWKTIWNRLGLSEMIDRWAGKANRKIKLDVAKYIEMMVVNRCVAPRSKLATSRWIDDTSYSMSKGYSTLDTNVEYFYRSMDYLLKAKDKIELDIFSRLRDLFSVNVKLTFYDITSTYLHTDNCALGAHGYSRDHRPDKEQIVIGIVTSYEGYPIKHYVFSGNTKDEKTVSEVVKDLKDTFNIEETAFVGDRGMLTKLNIDQLETDGFSYIMGVKIKQNEIMEMLFEQNVTEQNGFHEFKDLKIWDKTVSVKDFILWKIDKLFHSDDNQYGEKKETLQKLRALLASADADSTLKDLQVGISAILNAPKCRIRMALYRLLKRYEKRYDKSERFILAFNKTRAKATERERQRKLDLFSSQLDDLVRKITEGKLKKSADKALDDIFESHKRRFRKFFKFDNDGEPGKYWIDQTELERERRRDGFFVLTSNLSDESLSASKAVEEYKRLQEVETLFDDLKHFVDINPVRHWLENRVRCHVFLCVLALLLKRVLEIDCLKSKAVTEAIESVGKVKMVVYNVKFSEKSERSKTIPKVTTITSEQQKVFDLVGVKNPMALDNFAW